MLPSFTNAALHSPAEESMLEQAVLLLLQQLHVWHGGYLQLIDYYNGELDTDEGVPRLMTKLLGAAPAVLIASGTSRYERRSNRKLNWKIPIQLEVFVASNHFREHEFRMHVDPAAQDPGDRSDDNSLLRSRHDPGLYVIMAHVRSILAGRELGISGMNTLDLVLKQPVVQHPALTLWRMQFAGEFSFCQPRLDELGHFAADAVSVRMNLKDGDATVVEPLNPIVEAEVTS